MFILVGIFCRVFSKSFDAVLRWKTATSNERSNKRQERLTDGARLLDPRPKITQRQTKHSTTVQYQALCCRSHDHGIASQPARTLYLPTSPYLLVAKLSIMVAFTCRCPMSGVISGSMLRKRPRRFLLSPPLLRATAAPCLANRRRRRRLCCGSMAI